jgi:hypothetical protein
VASFCFLPCRFQCLRKSTRTLRTPEATPPPAVRLRSGDAGPRPRLGRCREGPPGLARRTGRGEYPGLIALCLADVREDLQAGNSREIADRNVALLVGMIVLTGAQWLAA